MRPQQLEGVKEKIGFLNSSSEVHLKVKGHCRRSTADPAAREEVGALKGRPDVSHLKEREGS